MQFYLINILPHGLLTLFYTLLCLYITPQISFFKKSKLSPSILRFILSTKITAALIYGLLYWYYYQGGDTWEYLLYSRMIHDTIYINPLYFLEIEFGPNARTPPDYLCEIIEPIMHWSDWRTYTVLRINALIHFLSFGYYGVHAVFFAFFSMTGLIGIYRLIAPGQQNYLSDKANLSAPTFSLQKLRQEWANMPLRNQTALFIIFGIPSIIFWASGVHKEALSLLGVGLSIHFLNNLLTQKSTPKNTIGLLLCFVFLLMLRSYVAILLVPAAIAWGLAHRKKGKSGLLFLGVYCASFLGTIISPLLHPKLNLFKKLSDIQYILINYYEGSTDIVVNRLMPHWSSVLMALPISLYNVIILPSFYFGGDNLMIRWPAAIETICLLCLLPLSLYYGNRQKIPIVERPFWYFCFFFSLTYFILIGLTNDNLGAIVRYRTTALPFWLWFWVLPIIATQKDKTAL